MPTLGMTIDLAPGDSKEVCRITDAPIPPMMLQKDFGLNRSVLRLEDSGVMSIVATYKFAPGAIIDATTVIEPFLTITWGTDGDAQEVDVDLRRGMNVKFPATAASVRATYPLVDGSSQPILRIAVGGGRGTLVGSQSSYPSATRTLIATDANGVPLPPQIIPTLATAAALVSGNPANAQLLQFPAPGAGPISIAQLSTGVGNHVPIAAGALFWQMAAASPGVVSRVQFALGI